MLDEVLARARPHMLRLAAHVPEPVRAAVRPLARRAHLAAPVGQWWNAARPPWAPLTGAEGVAPVRCNICRWTGQRFDGTAHVESAVCPRCGSIARDRFLVWCFLTRTPDPSGLRLLETSPRLGDHYRRYMRNWFDYRASDFDLSAHVADMQIDLQDIALPDTSLDVILTPHVLEHVPDTGRAVAELRRVLTNGGRVYLQVPVLQGVTGVPPEPEFHADNTPVFFRFGWDLTSVLRAAGFDVRVLVTQELQRWLTGSAAPATPSGEEFDLESMISHAIPHDLTSVATDRVAAQLGFEPAHQFVTWECIRR